jgi:dipeptidyl aminopeptidase/acylaminoacyl peptidase
VTTPFHDLGEYVAIPRVTGLRLSPDGTWLAASVATVSADRKKVLSSIWRIDPAGGPARRLTRSAEGEGSPRFLPDGSLLFISKRPDPDGAEGGSNAKPSLWLLPAGGGEARVIARLPGGVTAAETGSGGGIVITAPVLDATRADTESGTSTAEADERLRAARADAGVGAVLHESGIVRFWDADLGPDDLRLFAVSEGSQSRDLTPDATRAFIEHTFAVSPDGAWVATCWYWWEGERYHSDLTLIELATGNRKVLLSDPDADFHTPSFAPDGRSLACVRSIHDSPDEPGDTTLVLVSLDSGGEPVDLLPGFDRQPGGLAWEPAARFAYLSADDGGRRPVFRVDVARREVTRLTADAGHYTELAPSPDGTVLYALRDTVGEPPTPVRIDVATGEFERLPAPGQQPAVPGTLTEVTAVADDGQPIRAWLALPAGASAASPAPLLLWVHGGPRTSWSSWSWRWNPWLMAARGYAVLLPDPALSTGYGWHHVKRGYRDWGPRTFADVMAITDAAVARDDVDGARTAMMGGSFGGYMANWIAGHTGRFSAIVSHASLWAMDQMMATTDAPASFLPEFADPEVLEANSPHRFVAAITTPMLVIHGDRDYRVPIGEALRLWWDLQRHGKTVKFLYFPDENHWVLSPGNVRTWYSTVFAFLAHYVLGQPWQRPELL